MTYAAMPDMIARFGESEMIALTDLTGSGTLDDARLSQSLADASALIDGHLAVRYSLPLPSVPPVVTFLACTIARYLLCQRPTDEILKRFGDAMSYLEKVSSGSATLGGGAP